MAIPKYHSIIKFSQLRWRESSARSPRSLTDTVFGKKGDPMRRAMLVLLLVVAFWATAASAGTITVQNLASFTILETRVTMQCGVFPTLNQFFGTLSPGFSSTQTRAYSVQGDCVSVQELSGDNSEITCQASTAGLANPAEPDQIVVTYTGLSPSNHSCSIAFPVTPPPTAPPLAPSFLRVSRAQSNGGPIAEADWFDNSNDEASFRVERQIGSGSFQEIASLPPDTVTYQDVNVSAGHTYTYRVRACNVIGCSGYTNTGSITF